MREFKECQSMVIHKYTAFPTSFGLAFQIDPPTAIWPKVTLTHAENARPIARRNFCIILRHGIMIEQCDVINKFLCTWGAAITNAHHSDRSVVNSIDTPSCEELDRHQQAKQPNLPTKLQMAVQTSPHVSRPPLMDQKLQP